MNSSKSKQHAKKGFERKLINGKENPKYIDMLETDKPIANQNYVCMSIVSPEHILKKRELYFFEEFLKTWEFNKSMEKFFQFLNFLSFKYNLSFDDLTKDFKDYIEEERENLTKSSLDDDYKNFLDNHEDDLQKKFDIAHNFQTNIRGIKIRGSYPTQEEAELRCKFLKELFPADQIYVGQVGVWMPIDIEAYKTGRVEYLEEELNQLMHEKKKNEDNAKVAFEQRVKEAKQKAIDENIKNAEKSGNTLTQTIDTQGNLIGVNNVNTQEFALSEKEDISTEDICAQLFEGDNIITGKTDNGQSLLKSGPFAPTQNMEKLD